MSDYDPFGRVGPRSLDAIGPRSSRAAQVGIEANRPRLSWWRRTLLKLAFRGR